MEIVLARIDDRLIHGQVATLWAKETKCNRIIVCNDEVANDQLRKTLLIQVAPPGVKANVLTIEKAIEVYKNPKYNSFKALLLFTNPTDVLKMVEGGVDIKSVNIGGMSFKDGKKMITNAVSVDEKDIEAFKKLHEMGIELEIRKVSSDPKIDLMSKI
ncbi:MULTISPECIES: mannose/fructose/sorbose PTS transporter subunit IIB [Thermoanaerobacterium]|uniref:PTS system, mannose/fructose/sorbose family, IIB subunit n=2 Tax=Thermoanaerobacterium thermosaccharolyticum TaxID=1517 RepID=D9TRG0_THETC|nr:MULTISPECIES: mannose/fructose/sorbose PTS transporter subunit IIB [Thermoanaerobacterium]TCW31587.1 PTS system mannose-specific IIB component [Thermohydrogenium kirishiense]ADL69324.1 PTS system, mannose/fructose/sorbose family, IIB subunit [Thermoanaerobacterium thermosaccharolyticum DSM 571]KAA5805792.1 PTS fructose transporter subunit IIB [Thermoanaerobacterium thermosaccharolyticum]MCP2240840.1 PTS system mannose-specific IIB component [Thermoanaerobacterium thermosaccharolyticum]OXT08